MGKAGELFIALAFASALTALIGFLAAERAADPEEKKRWARLGLGSFLTHAASIIGIGATLFYLIYSHQYQYFYVWDHSSNELPVYYIIACFWEGQEGSFWLWCFWHSILGLILLRTSGEWRNSVLAIVASVELVLTSMLLGIFIGQNWVTGIYVLMSVAPAAYLAWRFIRHRETLPMQGIVHLLGVLIAFIFVQLLFREQLGYGVGLFSKELFSFDGFVFWLCTLMRVAYMLAFPVYVYIAARGKNINGWEIAAGVLLFAVSSAVFMYPPEEWKLGSTPFLPLKAAFPDDPVFAENPNFVPSNGGGLNPLLQNYWMVIHPPTLFLGFASTVVPFAYVMAGLIRRKYFEWIKPSLPWMSFSVMILGVGIIMGGYWAYETLNFGGYWNWDPVENSSFVPWLCGVASLHAMLIYQRSKGYLKMTQLFIISTFLLVLFSTFLTRSGILGETSVHTFTDLGLSGQLLLLLGAYVAFVVVMLLLRWNEIPVRPDESKLWSAEFMLFLGVLVFSFAGIVILFATSLPVFNAIFGTSFAPPSQVQIFYYQWTVWFAALFGIVSGIGQFLWWKMGAGKSTADALYRPFLMAVIAGSVILVAMAYARMNFAWQSHFDTWISPENTGTNWFSKLSGYAKYGIMSIADELLLYASLFGLFANFDVLFSLLRKNNKGLKVMGGTVVHIGFALMLIGMLFSSGFDEIISKNLRPSDLEAFSEKEKMDNVLIPKTFSVPIQDFMVTYTGRKQAKAPAEKLQVLEENATEARVAFSDALGDRYMIVIPRAPFVKEGAASIQPTADHSSIDLPGELDMELLKRLLNENMASFEPVLTNNRTQYGLQFTSLKDSTNTFTLYPEAEINQEMKSILSHPSRKVMWNRDVYVYTSSLPDPESMKPEYFDFNLRIGDTVRVGNRVLRLLQMQNLSGRADLKEYEVAAAAHVAIIGFLDTLIASPIFVIKNNEPGMISDVVEEAGMELAFVGVDPEKDLVNIQVKFTDPNSDFVVIKAISKPFINLLWLGTFILTFGFIISIYRRIQENRATRKA
ncbi:MAG: hypothetical protein EAZ89_17685 [Bacteroidetes bacterium]|nr:MAG: hypothetical protein EAZ89_17685 [Bacteroidota bacterium]